MKKQDLNAVWPTPEHLHKKSSFTLAKEQGLYHFDYDLPNDNDIILKRKFKGDFVNEISSYKHEWTYNLDVTNHNAQLTIAEWLEAGYDFTKQNHKMRANEHTPLANKIINSVPFENSESMIMWQPPFHHIPFHLDHLKTTPMPEEDKLTKGYRMLIMLTDWWPGEFMIWGSETIDHWKAGDVLLWPACKYPHGTANISHHTGYRIRIGGTLGSDFWEWMNSDEIVEV